MKKIYMAPEVEVVKLHNMNLLVGSPSVGGDGVAGDIGWGGSGDGVIPGAPEILPPGLEGIEGQIEGILFQ